MNDEPVQAPEREAPPPAGDGGEGSAEAPDGASGTTSAARRRRSRGGRGRGRATSRPAGAAGGDDSPQGPGDEPGADGPAHEGEPATGGDGEPVERPKPRRSPARRQTPKTSPSADDALSAEPGTADAPGEPGPDGGTSDDEGPEGTRTSSSSSARRRRRRGGRGRGRGGARPAAAGEGGAEEGGPDDAPSGPEAEDAPAAGSDEAPAPAARSRSRSRSAGTRTTAAAAEPEPADADAEPAAADGEAATEGDGDAPKPRSRSRRRRSGRSTATSTDADADADAATAEATAGGEAAAEADKPAATRSRSRSRTKPADKDGAKTKTPKEKGAAEPLPEPTRTSRRRRRSEDESSPTRTRRGTTRRRRDPIPLIKRTQDKVMLITENGDRDQIAVMEDRTLVEHYITRAGAHSMVGNIYLGRVQNVLPGMEAAFIDVGRGRNAVLYAGEVNYDDADLEGGQRRIEHVLKPGQSVLVQVTKDPIGGKGARLTAQVSIPGRYVVLVPDSQVFGISRRLPDEERRRLRGIIKQVRPDQHGVIVRTAAEGAAEEALKADVERLIRSWASIEKDKKKKKAPAVIYEEPELTVRVVRDLFTDEEFRELVTDSRRIHDQVRAYLAEVAPDLVEKVRFYDGTLPLFEEFHATEQIHKALDRKVWLPSGGYIIIERVEAMTVIDVNTGKHVGKTNLEETVVKTNLEAADEIARQLRLRDIGGIIIIDFIDMLLERNRDKIVDALKEAMAHDKTRSQVFDITPLGLLEVTRKRVSAGLLESFSETCPTCEGRGILLTHQT